MRIPDWVPDAARRRLEQLMSDQSLREDDRKLLKRLATNPAMKTEVWERLPIAPANAPDQIIHCAYYSVTLFSALVPTPLQLGKPPTKTDMVSWTRIVCERPPGAALDSAADLALQLARSMVELKSEYAFYWQQFWSGDKSVTLDQSIEFVCSLALFLDKVNKERQALIAALPKIKRPYSKKANEIFFTNMMSSSLERIYGRKLDAVVTALVEVVFDKKDGANQETIRARRREAHRRKLVKN